MNFCFCGTQAGYPHAAECPYPQYRGTDEQYYQWCYARLKKQIQVTTSTNGMRIATSRLHRLVQWPEGGLEYAVNVNGIGWTVAEEVPNLVQDALCEALGVPSTAG